MKLLILDPLMLTRLHRAGLSYALFSLEAEFYAEAGMAFSLPPDTLELYQELVSRGRLQELHHDFNELGQVKAMHMQAPGLARSEVLGYFLGIRHHCIVLASQEMQHQKAAVFKVRAVGYDWILDQLRLQHKISIAEVMTKWKSLKANLGSLSKRVEPACVRNYYNGSAEEATWIRKADPGARPPGAGEVSKKRNSVIADSKKVRKQPQT